MPAQPTPFPTQARTHEPALHDALAELLQLGLVVARVASRLAQMEDRAVDELAEAAAQATRDAIAPSASLGDAIAAGRNADASDAARDAIAARVASITESFDKAARAVRRTVALQARLAEGRPFHHPASPVRQPTLAAARTNARPANDAERTERTDTPETGDELEARPDKDILHDIRRDLAGAATSTPDAGSTPLRTAAALTVNPAPSRQPPPDFLPKPDT